MFKHLFKSKNYRLLAKSNLFDSKWYLEQNPDVKAKRKDPIEHYLKHGWKEGRKPSERFDGNLYLKLNSDVKAANLNPLIHYLKFGEKEGRVFSNGKVGARKLIRESPYWDDEWFLNYYRKVRQRGLDPVSVFLSSGKKGTTHPGPFFNSMEYLLLNPDVKEHNMNPLIHYEQWGWKENRLVSLMNLKDYVFPEGTVSGERIYRPRTKFETGNVTVLASFTGTGYVEDYVLYLLQGLQQVSDYVFLVCDNLLFPGEFDKLKKYCDACLVKRHKEYDFGSYKAGFKYIQGNGILKDEDNIIFVNDSNYGPVFPFDEVINDFKSQSADFYGLSAATSPRTYIQSFFYIFKPVVWKSQVFNDFLNSIKREISPACVVYNYEMTITQLLLENGFQYATYVPVKDFDSDLQRRGRIPTKFGLTLLQKYKYPFVKIKALQGSTVENPEEVLACFNECNPELYNLVQSNLKQKLESLKRQEPPAFSKYTLHAEYQNKIEELRKKDVVKVAFLVNMVSMFPAEGLMVLMRKDPRFDVSLHVIPDVRFGEEVMMTEMERTYSELKKKYDFVQYAMEVESDGFINYKDVVLGADIVCYPSPYNVSYSLYNPYYATGNGILSFHINYGFFRSKYDRYIYQLNNYNNFWKVFLETQSNMDEYARYGQCKASNAELVGYAKMDALKLPVESKKNIRPKIIIAPHHSVNGGTNEILALSNFERYADFFLELPQLYPEIDFVFRPHPVLFTVLSQPSKWGEERCKEYLEQMTGYPNVVYSTEGEYMDVFAQSDGIIQDCGSFLVEYFYAGKPCCYMLKSSDDIHNKFSDLGKACLEQCYIAYQKEDILKFLDEVICAGNDPKKETREKFRKEEVMLNYPNVSQVILERLKKELS